MPGIEGKLFERAGLNPFAAGGIAAVGHAASLGLVGRAAVDFLAHSSAPAKGDEGQGVGDVSAIAPVCL